MKARAVGGTQDSQGNWAHAFIWENNVMTDLNALFPANSNLYVTMISGMATVLSGPNKGKIHAFLASPVDASIGLSVAEVARRTYVSENHFACECWQTAS